MGDRKGFWHVKSRSSSSEKVFSHLHLDELTSVYGELAEVGHLDKSVILVVVMERYSKYNTVFCCAQ